MARTAAPVTQAEIARAIKGVKAAGVAVGRVEIGRDGRVIVYSATGAQQHTVSDLDKWRREHGQG